MTTVSSKGMERVIALVAAKMLRTKEMQRKQNKRRCIDNLIALRVAIRRQEKVTG